MSNGLSRRHKPNLLTIGSPCHKENIRPIIPHHFPILATKHKSRKAKSVEVRNNVVELQPLCREVHPVFNMFHKPQTSKQHKRVEVRRRMGHRRKQSQLRPRDFNYELMAWQYHEDEMTHIQSSKYLK